MTSFITGSTGLVGSHLSQWLEAKGEHIVSLIHNPRGLNRVSGLPVLGDVRDLAAMKEIMARYYVNHVYHLAALAEVKSAYKNPYGVYDVNVMGLISVLEAARQLDVEKVLVLLTDKVYGEQTMATENSKLQPSEPYGTSKICQQNICESYAKTYGMNIVWPHSCNIFGYDLGNRIFPNVIKQCIRGQSPAIFTNDESIREYIYIKDLVPMLHNLLLLEKGRGSFNISTGWVYKNGDIVREILKHFPGIRPTHTPGKLPPQIQEQTMRSIKLKSFQPKYSFEDAVEETVVDFIRFRSEWDITCKGGEKE